MVEYEGQRKAVKESKGEEESSLEDEGTTPDQDPFAEVRRNISCQAVTNHCAALYISKEDFMSCLGDIFCTTELLRNYFERKLLIAERILELSEVTSQGKEHLAQHLLKYASNECMEQFKKKPEKIQRVYLKNPKQYL
mmetsp:Transcript_23703/g.23397  ORF Transcript_23703/g.23397 Transcript_23703/m.23397 type:complete len:138 (+) Transcript_23703:2-415(+)